VTSNAQAIYNKLLEKHPTGLKSITELSYNDDGGRNFIVSTVSGFDYDLVYNCAPCYTKEFKEKSPDSLFCVDDKLYFVEFKDGKHDKGDIRLKIHEGVTTLYMFTRKHLPHISKADFIELDINYAVIVRGDTRSHGSSFQRALFDASTKYNLRNLEGLLVKKTGITSDPTVIVELLHKLTAKNLTTIDIFDYGGTTQTFSV